MAVWPNNFRSASGWGAYRHYGITSFYSYKSTAGSRLGFFYRDGAERSASYPDGYAMSGSVIPPIVAGGMSGYGKSVETITLQGGLTNGGFIAGSGTTFLSGDDISLSLVVGLSGTSTITLQGEDIELKLSIGLDGSGVWAITGDGDVLSLVVPFDGLGTFAITGISDLKGKLSMTGEWTPFTELSPESLAAAVWDALAASNNDAGSMGEKLNSAGTAGDPWTADLGDYESGTAGDQLKKALTTAKFIGLK